MNTAELRDDWVVFLVVLSDTIVMLIFWKKDIPRN